jgi:hypothetical protein
MCDQTQHQHAIYPRPEKHDTTLRFYERRTTESLDLVWVGFSSYHRVSNIRMRYEYRFIYVCPKFNPHQKYCIVKSSVIEDWIFIQI